MHRHRSSGVPLVLTSTCEDPELRSFCMQLQRIPSLEKDLRFPAIRKLRGLWRERAKKSFMMLTTAQQSFPGTWPVEKSTHLKAATPRLYFHADDAGVESMMTVEEGHNIYNNLTTIANLKCYVYGLWPFFPFSSTWPDSPLKQETRWASSLRKPPHRRQDAR